MTSPAATSRPAWWPTAEQKRHADAGCAHPDTCKLHSACGCMTEDPRDGFGERVVTHSATCVLHPEHDGGA